MLVSATLMRPDCDGDQRRLLTTVDTIDIRFKRLNAAITHATLSRANCGMEDMRVSDDHQSWSSPWGAL